MTQSLPVSDAATECHRVGQLAFPSIRWELSKFVEIWREFGVEAEPGVDEFVRLACLANQAGAVAILERDYIKPLRGVVRRICVTDDATDVALQALREKLLLPPTPRLASYRRSGSFRAWLKVVATRAALDVARRHSVRAAREVDFEDRLEAFARDPEAAFMSEEVQGVMRESLRAAVQRLPQEQRQALRMNVVSGWNITQIGVVFSVHRATVARWLLAAKERLGESLREEISLRVKGNTERDLVLNSLPSRMDIGLSRLFATAGLSGGSLRSATPGAGA